MTSGEPSLVFGPVPSRRLGRSLGINNIPPKNCSYSCVYCQLGRTKAFAIDRHEYYPPDRIVEAVSERVQECRARGEAIDYLTFVPDGEPTLDVNLGKALHGLKPLGIPIAVITNASLLWHESVRIDLDAADYVSMKVDTADPAVWGGMNRPHFRLIYENVMEGMELFASEFAGTVVTETMLVRGVNDSEEQLIATAEQIRRLHPETAYIAVPTRPPAEPNVQAPGAATLLQAMEIFRRRVNDVEYLIGHEGNAFASTGDVTGDLLSITAVHPLRDDALHELLEKNHADESVVKELIDRGELIETDYEGHRFYLRSFANLGSLPTGSQPKLCR
jgi:wyosine [tRNA(Phe)-imidazoG37] synthetase (radical SAM superfamily)